MTEPVFDSGKLRFRLPENWQEDARNEQVWFWTQTPQCAVEFTITNVDPQAAMPFGQDENVIDVIHKQSLDDDSGLIEVKSQSSSNGNFVHTIFKRKTPEGEPMKLMYSASMVARLDDEAFLLQFRGNETGMTGMRDAMVMSMAQKSGDINFVEDPTTGKSHFQGWFRDPYDENYVDGYLMNESEDAQYDEQFPEHPLSVIRSAIAYVVDSAELQ